MGAAWPSAATALQPTGYYAGYDHPSLAAYGYVNKHIIKASLDLMTNFSASILTLISYLYIKLVMEFPKHLFIQIDFCCIFVN